MDLGLRGGGTVGHDAWKTYLYICAHLEHQAWTTFMAVIAVIISYYKIRTIIVVKLFCLHKAFFWLIVTQQQKYNTTIYFRIVF